jgi:ABC-type uncharacterized transport system substrate-binding protein
MRIDTSIRRLVFGLACCLWPIVPPALAHPHVWVTMKEEVIFTPDGTLVGIRHAWTFDEMFSAYATQGIGAKTKGQFTRDELQPLAKLNVDSLKEDGYYTNTWTDGQKLTDVFETPTDYWFDYDPAKTELTLHVTLYLKTPLMAKNLMIQIYDPVFFVDFGLDENAPATLVMAPAQCALTTSRPGGSPSFVPGVNQLFTKSDANIGMGMQFASKISVRCP